MAQDYTVLDGIVADSPGASIDDDFFSELKLNLEELDTRLGTAEGDLSTAQGDISDLESALGSLPAAAIGTDSFAGISASVTVTFSGRDTTDYHVSITPTESPGGNLGEVWVTVDDADNFTVYNSGTATTGFMWCATYAGGYSSGGGGGPL